MKKIIGLILFCAFISCEEVLYEEDISTNSVSLLAPTNGVSITAGAVSFKWQQVNGATDYQLQVARPAFTNAVQIVLDTIISRSSFIQQLEVNNYEWRVRALNSAYETEYTCNEFEVVAAPEP